MSTGDPAIRPFTSDHAALVSSWAPTLDEVVSWCARSTAPVPPEVIAGWSDQPEVHAYLLVQDGRPVAYGELWIDDDEHEVELARVLVDRQRRGRHLGRTLARQLADEAHQIQDTVFLRVRPGNDAAVACYRAAGFTRVDPGTEDAWNQAQPTPYWWMTFG